MHCSTPQQFKQLIMVSGFFISNLPCFRDQDARSNEVSEFYQLDLEMSFVEQRMFSSS